MRQDLWLRCIACLRWVFFCDFPPLPYCLFKGEIVRRDKTGRPAAMTFLIRKYRFILDTRCGC